MSNVSFSFRGNDLVREAMHSCFLYQAIRAGLDEDAAIRYFGENFRGRRDVTREPTQPREDLDEDHADKKEAVTAPLRSMTLCQPIASQNTEALHHPGYVRLTDEPKPRNVGVVPGSLSRDRGATAKEKDHGPVYTRCK